MGGRKSYSVSKVVGSSGNLNRYKRELSSALDEKNPKDILQKTITLFTKSNEAVKNLGKVTEAFDLFIDDRKIEAKKEREFVSDFWSKRKEEKHIETSPEIERLIVDSVVETIRRRARK